MSTLAQASLPLPNIANNIAKYLNDLNPKFIEWIGHNIVSVWFTGSRVWWGLYNSAGYDTIKYHDLDIFTTYSSNVGFKSCPQLTYAGQCGKYAPTQGDKYTMVVNNSNTINVDIWQTGKSMLDSLMDYPSGSHGHARAAFSFTEGLVVLPN